ncbi:hypothetical protein LF887_20525 [Chryseobacterium sp. MEBOG06]|uniref:hypothetical protein n=1 Tax=Chryseobacterium sp. MEBOG06 TaxID=2879938 RepID=UPI001F254F9E|nr:hypothetical protein [Chryseobacterium sp. MEBOG06]UKB83372.1 hypothetical protein LF887_20525 [Chryseobacterium sp. MEBOG06]
MKNKIYIKNVIIFSLILFLANRALSVYFHYFNLGSFLTGDTLLFSIYWYALTFSYILAIYFALRKTILESKELKLAKLIVTSLAIIFIAYNLSFLAEYIQYYYIDEKDKIVTHNAADRLKDIFNGEDNSAPSYEPFSTFIKYPYLVLVDIFSGFKIIKLFFFLITDRIMMPILLSLALYKWYKKHPEKIK